MKTELTFAKINNEYELCEINNPECKQIIEKEFLKNRISYFIRWNKAGIFAIGKAKNQCTFCVNDNSLAQAEEIVRGISDEYGYSVKFLMKRSSNHYL